MIVIKIKINIPLFKNKNQDNLYFLEYFFKVINIYYV